MEHGFAVNMVLFMPRDRRLEKGGGGHIVFVLSVICKSFLNSILANNF